MITEHKFSNRGKFAIIAGSGSLPLNILENLLAQKLEVFIILIEHNFDARLLDYIKLYNIDFAIISLGSFGSLIKKLRSHKVKNIVLAGGVSSRPSLADISDIFSLYNFIKLVPYLLKGDDNLLKAVLRLFEHYGFNIVGCDEIAPNLLADKASLQSLKKPSAEQSKDIKLAINLLKQISCYDIGQGAVVLNGRIIAIEGPEGTDAMIARVGKMFEDKKLVNKQAILVKMAKQGQERRVDLPTIGEVTIENLYKCGFCGVAIEAGSSLILQQNKVMNLADVYKIFVEIFDVNDE